MIIVGVEVGWLWAGSLVIGTAEETHYCRHEILTKGKRIVRNGTSN